MYIDDDARLNELICAILDVVQTVRPRPGFLASLGVTKFDQKLIEAMLDEHYLELKTFEEYREYKLNHEDRDVRASFDFWVPLWEDGIRTAVDNLLPRIADD